MTTPNEQKPNPDTRYVKQGRADRATLRAASERRQPYPKLRILPAVNRRCRPRRLSGILPAVSMRCRPRRLSGILPAVSMRCRLRLKTRPWWTRCRRYLVAPDNKE